MRGVFKIGFVTMIVMAALAGNVGCSSSTTTNSAPPTEFSVEYRFSGTASRALIVLLTPSGNVEQHIVTLPWSISYPSYSFFAYSANITNWTGSGTVTAEIFLNGRLRYSDTGNISAQAEGPRR